MDPQTRDIHAREPVSECVGLELGFLFRERVGIGRVRGVLLVDGEVGEAERLVGIRQSDGVDGTGVAESLDAQFGGGAEAVEAGVHVVAVDAPVVLVDGVGEGGEVDDGVAAAEGVERVVVGVGRVGGAHFRVRGPVVFLVGSVDLDGVVAGVRAGFHDLSSNCASSSCDCDLHGGDAEYSLH